MKKRLLAMMLVCVTILSLCTSFASAASSEEGALGEVNIYNGGYKLSYLSVNGIVRTMEYTYFNHINALGVEKEVPAYCVNPNTAGVPQTVAEGESIEYLADSYATDPKVVGIIANGYPHRGLSELKLENKYQAYYATKVALWCYLLSNWDISRITVNPNLTGLELERAQKILAATKDIYNRGIWWSSIPQASITATPDKEYAYSVNIDGQTYKQQIFTLRSDSWVCDYNINVSFTSPNDVPAGTRIVNTDNQDITAVTTTYTGGGYEGQFKVLYPADSVGGETGSVQLSFSANVYKYAVMYAICAEKDKYGNLQNYMCDTDPTTAMKLSAYSKYASQPDTELPDTALIIQKIETGTQEPLAGAVFEVKDPDGAVMGSFSTDQNGQIIIPCTKSGQYVVTETAAPKYHLLSATPTKTVQVVYGNSATVTFENKPFGTLRVEKVDADSGTKLSGALIQIRNLADGTLYTGTTATGGAVTFTNLTPGSYEVKELTPPNGYVLDSATQTVQVTTGTSVTCTLKDLAKPGLIIVKVDAKTLTRLPETSFEIYKDATLIGTYMTDQLGEITLYDVEPGTYLVKEVSTDSAHVVNSSPQQIELSAGDGIKQLIFFNELKPGIHILKVDSSDMKAVANVRFKVSLVGGAFAKEYTTDQNGEIDLTALEPGAYTVEELEAPTGYLMDDSIRIIQINAGENAKFVFTNTPKPTLSVVKYDAENNKYLGGATFRIAKIEDGSRYLDRITDANGRITLEGLDAGVYSVQEIAAPGGYVLDSTEYHVELFPGRTSEIVVNNIEKPDLRIVKTDVITGAPIADVTFTVNKADSSTLTTVTTGADGTVLLQDMDPGVYQVREQSVPNGYLLDTTPQLVTLVAGKTATVQFQNYPKPNLTINKVDSITGDPIKGAKFHIIYASNNTFTGELNDLGIYYTDENGQITISHLNDGWYRVTEVEPATGYAIKDPATQDFYLSAGVGKVVTFENTPLSALIIKKVDADTGDVLQGAKFRVRYLGGTSGTGGTIIGEYTTSVNGTIVITGLAAGTYIVEETKAPAGYEIDETPQTVYISGKNQDVITVEFSNGKHGNLIIQKIDSVTKQPLAGAQFTVTTSEGAFVGNYGGTVTSNGIYTTDSNGQFRIVDLQPGTYVVTEIKAPDGYVLDETPQVVWVSQNDTQTLTFSNTPIGGFTIIKTDYDNGARIKGAQFEVRKANGEIIGTYSTDANGVISLPNLVAGWYIVTETRAASGYLLDATEHRIEVKDGTNATLSVTNKKASSILIHKIDADTGKGIYGVTFVIYDAGKNPIDQVVTDQKGYAYVDGELTAGKYYIRELEPADGYLADTQYKTVYVKAGQTTTVEWENTAVTGQIQITKYASEANSITGQAAGVTLKGAVFEIVRERSGVVVDYITTDSRGVAASDPLPLGRYIIREVSAPAYYQVSAQTFDVTLEYAGQIIKLSAYDKPAELGVTLTKTGNKEVLAGNKMLYRFTIANTSNVALENFYFHDKVPYDVATASALTTGTYNQRLTYRILYKTNYNDYRVLASNLLSTNTYSFAFSALQLMYGEVVTDIYFDFGTVPSGFQSVIQPTFTVSVSPKATNGYYVVNRADAGGKYQGTWQTANASWITIVRNLTPVITLPKTGY